MFPTRFTEDIRPISDLRSQATEIVDQVCRNRRPMLLTQHGRGVVVLLAVEDYHRLVGRAAFIDAIEAGAQSARGDQLCPNDKAMEILDSFGDEIPS